jgi:hypothetical protein
LTQTKGGIFMANDYTGNYEGIATGEPLSSEKMTAALNKMEKVANKVTSLSSSSTDGEYPSAKVVYDSLNGASNDVVHKSGAETITGIKTFGKTGTPAEPLLGVAKTAAAADNGTKFASEAQVFAVSSAVNNAVSASSSKQDKLPIGTILMFDGYNWVDNQTMPGWFACTAGNSGRGCPNLVNSFIKGSATATHSSGGNSGNEITISANNLPTHTHALSGSFTTGNQSAGHTHSIAHDHAAVTSGGGGGHTHTVYMKIKGGQGAHEIFNGWGTESEWGDCENAAGVRWSQPFSTSNPGNHTHSVDIPNFTGNSGAISANHTHSVTLSGSTGNNTTTAAKLSIEPQSYALIFIRRCE